MDDGFVVLVGRGVGGQEAIIKAVMDLGIKAEKTVECCWPRDDYVHFKGRYITSHRNGVYNPLGDGGNVLTGDGFILASDYALWLEYGHATKTSPEEIYDASIEAFEEYFPDARLWVAPTGFQEAPSMCDHIDLFSFLCPKRRILALDTYYGRAANHRIYDIMAEREGLKIIRYDGAQDMARFPLNAKVLPASNEADIVLLDDKSTKLIRMLKDEGVNPVGIPMPQIKDAPGKIGCQTNFYFPRDGVKPQDLLRIV